MKLDTPVPFQRLKWFQEKLGLGDREQNSIVQHRAVFLEKKQRFSEEFFRYFWEIKETRIILDHERRGPHLKKLWEQWYELIFTEGITPKVLGVLWRSGLRHVELNIDKRFINLGYAFVDPFISYVDPKRCSGCRMCEQACVAKAIKYDETKRVVHVEEAACMGCGLCNATCPSSAIGLKGYIDCMIDDEISAFLEAM